MSIYNQPVRILLTEMTRELIPRKGMILSKNDALKWFSEKYPKIKKGTISAHLIRFSTNAKNRLHYTRAPGEENVLYQIDGSHFRLYDPESDPKPISHENESAIDDVTESDETEEQIGSDEFAYEADLKNYLSKNLESLESGLSLYDDEGITGVEFPVGGRFIDILAVDSKGDLVVIELKVSRGYDRVIGQLMRYMAWIKKHQADENQNVRGIIVAREITEDLKLACSLVPNIDLFEYKLSLSFQEISH